MSEQTMNLNYFGTLHILKAFLPGMVKRGKGEVALVSSAAAVCGIMLYRSMYMHTPSVCSLVCMPEQHPIVHVKISQRCLAPFLMQRRLSLLMQRRTRLAHVRPALQAWQATAHTRPARRR